MGKIGDLWVRLGLKKDEFDKGLKDSEKKSESFASKLKKNWKAVAAGIAMAAAAVRGFANAFSKIAEFEQANANLSTILGKNVKEIKALTDSAMTLGRTTEYTASQVTSLQTELAKLGFNEVQIQQMQKSILNFATAVGTDLASAAALTGSTLRGFGLDAKDTEEVLGALAVATNKSALSFSTLSSGLSIVMPVAKAFGFSVKDTTAMLGTLVNAGFDASSAATATRNILLYLANDNSKLNKLLGTQVKTLPQLIQALQKLKQKGVDLNTTLEATDKRAVAAFNALLNGASSTMELRDALEETDGELQRISEERLATVEGSVKILQSAWEGLILSMKNSTGVIKSILDMVTELISGINYMFSKSTRQGQTKDKYLDMALNASAKGASEAAIEEWFQGVLGNANQGVIDSRGRSDWRKFWDYLYSSGTNTTGRKIEQYDAIRAAYQAWRDSLVANEGSVGGGAGMLGDDTTGNSGIDDLLKKLQKGKKTPYQEAQEKVKNWLLSQKADRNWTTKFMGDVAKDSTKLKLDIAEQMEREAEDIADAVDDIIDAMSLEDLPSPEKWASNFQEYMDFFDRMSEAMDAANQQIRQAIVYGISDSFGTLADAITGVEKIDATKAFAALLKPMADAVTSIGEMVMLEGFAMLAFKNSIKNPYAAIAAGAALIAVGQLASSGIQKALNGGTSSSSATSSSSSGTATDYSGELTIYVKGEIKGDAIAISGQKAINSWNR